jgi:hypothetical protein
MKAFCEPFSAVAVSPDLSCLGNPETQKICNPNHKKPRPIGINQNFHPCLDSLTHFNHEPTFKDIRGRSRKETKPGSASQT